MVTTPQLLSQIDVVKGIEMWKKVNVPICGLVRNMTYYQCTQCGAKQNVFNHENDAFDFEKDFGIKRVYDIPIYPLISRFSDYGDPIVLNDDGFICGIFEDIARGMVAEVEGNGQMKGDGADGDNEDGGCRWNVDEVRRVIMFEGCTLEKGTRIEMGFVDLRFRCKCALCRDEMTNKQILRMEDIDKNIGIYHVERVGNYGVKIVWSDKHQSIYSLADLQKG